MSTRYYGVPTNIGTAAIANAALLGVKLDIKTFVVGDGGGSYYEPTPDMTALRRETWRGNIAFCEIDENMSNVINVAAYLPSDVGGFTAREIGALDSKGQLIGVANVPDAQIVKFEDGVTDESMFILSFAVTNPEVFNWYADPTVIIASKADIEKHNTSASSHPDIRALLNSLSSDLTQVNASLSNKVNKSDLPLESGTWTPSFAGTQGVGNFNYSQRSGIFSRIGDFIFVRMYLAVNSVITAPAGGIKITGLPFSGYANLADSLSISRVGNISLPSGRSQFTALVSNNEIFIYMLGNNTSVEFPDASEIKANTEMSLSGIYLRKS